MWEQGLERCWLLSYCPRVLCSLPLQYLAVIIAGALAWFVLVGLVPLSIAQAEDYIDVNWDAIVAAVRKTMTFCSERVAFCVYFAKPPCSRVVVAP